MEKDFEMNSLLGLVAQLGQSFLLNKKEIQLHVEEHFSPPTISWDYEQQAERSPRSLSM